jgi:hypothetical protein
MAACLYVATRLRRASDLDDPLRDDAPRGAMARTMERRSGVPPKAEIDAMKKRGAAARSALPDADIAVLPIRVWGRSEGDRPGAEDLARRIAAAGLARASAAADDPKLAVRGDPNELKVLWDTARALRTHLREHPLDADLVLLVDAAEPPRVRHVHVILCDGAGEWLMVDLQNNHHPDFSRIAPDSLEDCVALAFERLKARLREPDAGKDRE